MSHNLRFALPLLALACGSEPEAPDRTEPTPYVLDIEGGEAPQVDLALIGQELAEFLPTLRGLNAAPALSAYQLLAAEQTASCPRTYAVDGNTYWADQCTTESGTQFSGFAFAVDLDDQAIGRVWRGRQLVVQGGARVERADGVALDIAGVAQKLDLDHVDQPIHLYHSTVNGTFSAENFEFDPGWIEREVTPDLVQFITEHKELGGRRYTVVGGVSGTGGALSAIVFDEVTVVEPAAGGSCPREPFGLISVRTGEGVWVDLLFDGPDPQTGQAEGDCDGVGRAYHRGELLGEVTLDTRVLFDFEGAPW